MSISLSKAIHAARHAAGGPDAIAPADIGADVAGAAAAVTKGTLGLGSVDNTADSAKLVSTAQQTALNLKLDTTVANATFVPQVTTTAPSSNLLRTISTERGNFFDRFNRYPVDTGGGVMYENAVWSYGYNVSPALVKNVLTESSCRIAMESSWWTGGLVKTEVHIGAYIDASQPNTSEIRPYDLSITHGGDGGKGSVGHSWCVGDDAAGGVLFETTAGVPLLQYTATRWQFGRNVIIAADAGISQLTVGNHNDSARVFLNAKASGGTNQIDFGRDTTLTWSLYDAGGVGLYLRDMVNAKMHMAFYPGAGHTGSTEFDSSLKVDGNVGFYNTAPVAKPTVTGAKGSNAALASLLTALASQGLLTDSSTA